MKSSINSVESFGLVDGPGIRTVIFFNGCKLRCKYCHNPEMWKMGDCNTTVEELVTKIKRFKPYYGKRGGVTLSGGEPLMQIDFLIELCQKLKEEKIHIALDTAGVGIGKYRELLTYIDLIILDIKHTNAVEYRKLTGGDIEQTISFIDEANHMKKKFWIRQVIIPGLTDSLDYIKSLEEFLHRIDHIEKIEFLPYHKLGSEKYEKLNIPNPYRDLPQMDIKKCESLYQELMKRYEK